MAIESYYGGTGKEMVVKADVLAAIERKSMRPLSDEYAKDERWQTAFLFWNGALCALRAELTDEKTGGSNDDTQHAT